MRSQEGSITKLGDQRYRVRVTVGFSETTGKQMRTSVTVRGTLADARRARDRLVRESGGATAASFQKMSVYEFTRGEWLPTRKLRPTTLAGYESTLENHIRPGFSRVAMKDANALHIRKVLNGIEKQGAALNVYKMLRSVFALAVDSGIVPMNPLSTIPAPELDDYEADVYTLPEIAELFACVRGLPIEPGVIIAATCGPRVSETCALDWSDVTLERYTEGGTTLYRGSVDFYEGYHRLKGKRLTTEQKTKRSKRVVAIPGFAVKRLMEIRGIGPLMIDNTGQRMAPGGFTSRWRRLLLPREDVNGVVIYEPPMRYIQLKNLRHSQSTILLDLGATMHEVAMRDGHSRESTTDKFYNKPGKQADHSTAERMNAAMLVLTRPKNTRKNGTL